MDDAVLERLSRFLDGDLAGFEAVELERRLALDSGLRRRLQALEELRGDLRRAADSEEAPATLDVVVDPLLRSRVGDGEVRPWVRWLAAAAAVVFAATVGFEITQRGGSDGDRARRSQRLAESRPTEVFRLAPLPTSALPPEEQPLGAGDRLLASPLPDVEVDDPPPMEVPGPFEGPVDRSEPAAESTHGERRPAAKSNHGSAEAEARERDASQAKRGSAQAGQEPAVRGGRMIPHDGWEERAPRPECRLFVFIEGRTEWRCFEPSAWCKSGRFAVRIEVVAGRVVGVWPLGAATSPSPEERLCAADLVRGLEIDDVPDGEHRAEVLIEPAVTVPQQ